MCEMNDTKQTLTTPYQLLGASEELVHHLVRVFYARMAATESDLAQTHQLDAAGLIAAEVQQRFALFLIEWLGGQAHYSGRYGHPRLRMRHGHVPITVALRDAWLRCMTYALDELNLRGEVRNFLDTRFAEVADFLRNQPEPNN